MDWRTWSPFQSETVRQICANMSPDEKKDVAMQGRIYGVWVALTFAIPIGLAVAVRGTVVIVIAAIAVLIHIACIPLWWKSQRRFLCNTKWAREQRLEPAQLKLFGMRRKKGVTA